ncbi:hypothetical protein ERJ75_000728600 [Trypanosoma vivax]|uniref:Uncharacterized protein n=1 Tax=Trypanosoma vivax (strain Y486) TaxID=1055687 RepID=G0TX44_TRYVY|nr:hypothetical protein TRVL_07085 [Trypanosoma vivax]KAH8613922.1 hypothetical protein ERJ75_000728600 [Trypanosoma vivax]CCC48534.1 conserved hypothetical protein [Trypanosoma vivax Y486]
MLVKCAEISNMETATEAVSHDTRIHVRQKHDLPSQSTFRRAVRTTVCATLFAVPFCVSIPSSPLLKLSQTQDAKKTLIPRMMSDFFYVNFLASGLSYYMLVEPKIANERARHGFMPWLGPVTAQVPALSCLVASHLFYPGMWALFNERTWRERLREFARLNTKCFFAYFPIHVPAAVAIGVAVGTILYPFKLCKKWQSRADRTGLEGAMETRLKSNAQQ